MIARDWERAFYTQLGHQVRAARAEAGLSQSDVAEQLALTRASVANLEAGRQRILIHQAVVLADALGVELATLLLPAEASGGDPVAAQVHRAAEQAHHAAARQTNQFRASAP